MMAIAIVALVVLGPEKLPKIARTVGKFYGSMQRYMSGFKADIEREVALDNMRKATAEAQQKLLELQSQVKVLSGEIPELAARAQEGGENVMDADSLHHEHVAQTIPELVPSPAMLAETSVKDDEELWKKKA